MAERIFKLKNPKSSEFDVESKNTGKIKLRSLEMKPADMCITFTMLLKIGIRSSPLRNATDSQVHASRQY